MKNNKKMCIVFAVLAAALMLMTPTMARPVQEKTTMDPVEQTMQEINTAMDDLMTDRNVAYAMRLLEQAENEEEILAGLEQLSSALENNPEFAQLLEDGQGDLFQSGTDGPEWLGFKENIFGDILVDGEWISPDDPLYGFWLNFENYMQDLGMSTGDILIIIGIIMYVGACGLLVLYSFLIAIGVDLNDTAWLSLIYFLGIFGPYIWGFGKGLNNNDQP